MAKHRTLFRLVDEDRHFSSDLSPIHIVTITNLHDYDHCGVCRLEEEEVVEEGARPHQIRFRKLVGGHKPLEYEFHLPSGDNQM